MESPEVRFWRYVIKLSNDECWLWTGGKSGDGYGLFGVGSRTNGTRKKVYAHRFTYELLVGPIPEGLELDHTCKPEPIRNCVNPFHLEPVTHKENVRRGKAAISLLVALKKRAADRTHCPHGHPYSPENIIPRYKGRSGRICLTCKRKYDREYKQRIKHR